MSSVGPVALITGRVGLWCWSSRHPDWHPGQFGAEVVSFLARTDHAVVAIDPLLPAEPSPELLGLLDREVSASGRLVIAITIGYHVRSAELLWQHYRDQAEVVICGPKTVPAKLGAAATAFVNLPTGEPGPAGLVAQAIGNPRRSEAPLYLPDRRALVFGDAVVGGPAGPVIWSQRPLNEPVLRFHRRRFNPSLAPLLDLEFDHLLLTHGPSVIGNGREALARAIAADPWYHRG